MSESQHTSAPIESTADYREGKARVTPLDTLFVLFVSCFLLLLILWLAFTLLGSGEQFAQLPPWVEQIAGSFWGWLSAGGSAVLIGWLNRRSTRDAPAPRFTVLIPVTTFSLAASVLVLAFTLKSFFIEPAAEFDPHSLNDQPVTAAGPFLPEKYRLSFALDLPEGEQPVFSPDTVSFLQQAPRLNPLRYSAMQPDRRFHESIDIPPAGNTFIGSVRQKVLGSVMGTLPPSLTICLQRSAEHPPAEPHHSSLECNFDEGCSQAADDHGWLSPCASRTSALKGMLDWFPAAHADPQAASGWVVPSLDTLKSKTYSQGTGYSAFSIALDLPQAPAADRYRYAVLVNGTPLYFDGFEPHELTFPYAGEKTLEVRFGLENLNFRGLHKGRDQVELRVEFLQGDEVVQHYDMDMPHVALRSTTGPQTRQVGAATCTWQSRYWKAEQEFEYETFVSSTTDPEGAERVRKTIDACELVFNGRRVFGVVRPPLGGNRFYGVTVGLENALGQIEFTFSKQLEAELRQWVKQQAESGICRGGLRKDAYPYRIGSQ